ncbi:MAG: hypothetical protein A2W90_23470 [Bacteroidetes bacterium GWF2_42_66]|nr:MAG: hypothetical protein A2W92_20140 [Bacteroidetes bacterium GWA2_42_15]OFY00343.1 MAG: hypothetical protein A2W89_14195 [Bacteroidetes bacterium GWE2_42_39]OFY47087.1 MAG: hypothetical protein A2W90_23470 [Bacteroidetes bacterium GWF2_42_66]HBL76743.1 hypothetical protein [Prolixibacteraceae bacterium]HCU62876.1 hypothetical protein [Prolixibacteraceae bacterium]
MKHHIVFSIVFILIPLLSHIACAQEEVPVTMDKMDIHGVLGTYANPPLQANNRVDAKKLIRELRDIHANTYNWLIWTRSTDWDDLKLFLPLAEKENIRVWVTLVPPTESKPIAKYSSEPFELDYERWAKEIALLSVEYPNLVAWSIDDFVHNLKFYTPEYLQKILDNASSVNPKLAFIPCCYYKQITLSFAENYRHLLHGILFPYRAESHTANLQDSEYVELEINKLRTMFGQDFPIFLDIYATAHSRLGDSTPQYVGEVIKAGRKFADGVLIYCHQNPEKSAKKYQIIKKGFK